MLPAVLTENARTILAARYVDKEYDKTVEGLWDRVSLGNPEYRRMMADLIFLPNSPALFNMGLPNGGTSSACFVFSIQDSLLGDWPLGGLPQPFADSIFGTRFKAAAVAKAGGGVGYYLGNIRPKNAEVKSTHKRACGPVAVLRDLNGLRSLITQGGKRDLAQMGVLNATHPDIRDFIHCLSGDTKVSTPTGEVEIKDMVGTQPLVYAVRGRKVFVQRARKVWKTGVRRTIRIHLDKGGPIICTPEHLIMLRTGEYKPAGELVAGDRLMAFYRSPQRTGASKRRYWLVGVTGAALSQKSARLVMEYVHARKLKPSEHVDHEDNNPLNDDPSNLQVLSPRDHTLKTKKKDGFTTKGRSPTEEQTAKRLASRKGYVHSESTKEKMRKTALANIQSGATKPQFPSSTGRRPTEETRAKMRQAQSERRRNEKLRNHKVVRVEPWETMAVYDMEVPEFDNFIANGIVVHNCKDEDPQALGSFNISVSWRDEQLKQIDLKQPAGKGEWNKLWVEQCTSAWKSGDPGVLFWDAINRFNPTPLLGSIEATNPCGEVPELSDEPCNLGSLSLVRFLTDHGPLAKTRFTIDWDALRAHTRLAVRFLDDILDKNNFPHPDITRIANLNRKLGLGVMALADVLAYLAIPYDSQAAVDLSKEFARHQELVSLEASVELANEKGPYPQWANESAETKDRFPWCRNSTRTSIAPTGTISIIAGVWGAIEPFFAFDAERTTYEGIKMNDGISDATRAVLHQTGHVPKVASAVDWRWHVRHQAAWQAHTDLGVSKTINLPNEATVKDISDAYLYMWETGCKGGTVFRDGCRDEQVLVKKKTKSVYSTVAAAPIEKGEMVELTSAGAVPFVLESSPDMSEKDRAEIKAEFEKYSTGLHRFLAVGTTAVIKPAEPNGRRKLPDTRQSVTHKFKLGGVKIYLTVGLFEDGSPGEVFLRAGKQGSTLSGVLDALAISLSTNLQHGVSIPELIRRFGDTSFPPQGFTGNPELPNATSITDYVVRWLGLRFARPVPATPTPTTTMSTGDFCPDCSAELIKEGNCRKCIRPGCGFSKC